MPAGRKISEHIDEFNKIVLDLANIGMKIFAIIITRLLIDNLTNTLWIPCSMDEIFDLEDVMATTKFQKEIKERSQARGIEVKCYIEGQTDRIGFTSVKEDSQDQSPRLEDSSAILQSEDHLRETVFSLKNNHKKSTELNYLEYERIIAYTLYVTSLDGHAMAGELNASVEEKDSLAQVWHKRLGHMSEAGLQVLEKQGLFGKKSLEGIVISQVPHREAIEKKDTYRMWFGHPSDMDVEIFGPVSKAEIESTKSLLKKEFDMKELREAKKILDNGKSVKMPLGGHFKAVVEGFPNISYLCMETYPHEKLEFLKNHNIQLFQFGIDGTKATPLSGHTLLEDITALGVLSVEEVDVGELGCGGVLGMLRQRGM
ncbi:retrovirus-related pol polyprotein from transposon TNT 1-94 [Tanacetum coccineum]